MTRLTRLGVARALAVGAGAATLALASAGPVVAHDKDHPQHVAQHQATIAVVPPLMSNNMELVGSVPNATGISGDYAISTKHFYLSTLEGITVLDISKPEQPVVKGKYVNSYFENEAMNYGERRADRKVTDQFVLIGVDLQSVDPLDPVHTNIGGGALIVVDVTNPNNPHARSRVKATTSTHTVSCVREIQCRYAYTAGSKGKFSIIDLTNLDNPKEVDSDPTTPDVIDPFDSPAAAPGAVFTRGAGHKWNFDRGAIGFHTGSAGTAAFDVSKPADPKLLTTTGAAGRGEAGFEEYNNFIHHNSWHPHHNKFRADAPAALSNGNVLLITEEDYEQTDCSLAGSFQTWKIDGFDRPDGIKPLDKVELADLGGPTDFVPPVGTFCSAHWFDYHQSGIAAVGYYGGGVRLVDVRDPKDIKPYGYAVGGETWDAYWLPQRRANGTAELPRTNILYQVDLLTGLTVYRVNLPAGNAGQRATTAGATQTSLPTLMNHSCGTQMAGAL